MTLVITATSCRICWEDTAQDGGCKCRRDIEEPGATSICIECGHSEKLTDGVVDACGCKRSITGVRATVDVSEINRHGDQRKEPRRVVPNGLGRKEQRRRLTRLRKEQQRAARRT